MTDPDLIEVLAAALEHLDDIAADDADDVPQRLRDAAGQRADNLRELLAELDP